MTDLDISLGDFRIVDGDMAMDSGLTSIILTSLFSDARLPDALPLPAGEWSRRGFWAEVVGTRYGSLLWTVHRNKINSDTSESAREAAIAALTWLVEDGIAEKIEVSAAFFGEALRLEISPVRGSARLWPQLWLDPSRSQASISGVDVLILPINS